MKNKLKIVFFGTPEFASSQLEALMESEFEVVAVVTVPDKPAGRGKKIMFSDVKQTAIRYGLPVLQPEKLRDEAFISELKSFDANLFVVVAFRMLPEIVWSIPEFGTFNLHASLLPQYRGAAPINYAIINGETETGNTTFFIDREIDKGCILMQEKVMIAPNETAGELHDELMDRGRRLVVETVRMIAEGNARPIEQQQLYSGELKPAPKISREFCNIDWNRSGKDIFNHVRGLSPYPAAHTVMKSAEGESIELKVYEVELLEKENDKKNLSLSTDGKNYLKVALSDSTISFRKVQQAGKKAMSIHDFLIGQRLEGEWSVE